MYYCTTVKFPGTIKFLPVTTIILLPNEIDSGVSNVQLFVPEGSITICEPDGNVDGGV